MSSGCQLMMFSLVANLVLRIFHPLATHSCCSSVSSLLCRVPSDQTTDISQVYKNTPSQIFFLCDHVSHPNCHTAPQTAVLTQLKGWGQEFLKLALPLKKMLVAPHPPSAWEKRSREGGNSISCLAGG